MAGRYGGFRLNAPCILAQEKINGDSSVTEVPSDGRILTGFRFQGTGSVALSILRETAAGISQVDGTNYVPSGPGVEAYGVHIPVQRGDFIGLKLGGGASMDVLNAIPGQDTNAWELNTAASSNILANAPYELLLDATIEADADCDGQGDDSEDPDGGSNPLAELRCGKRPKLRLLGKTLKASKKGVVKMTLKNTNGYRVKGKLTLKAGRLKLGSKSFSVGASSQKSVRIKLSARAYRKLKRNRKLKASASAKLRGPIGKAGTAKKRVTITAPRKRKPRRGGGGGGGGGGGEEISACDRYSYIPGYIPCGTFGPNQNPNPSPSGY